MNSGFPYLDLLIFIPAGGAILIALLSWMGLSAARTVAFVVSMITLGFAISATAAMTTGVGGFQLVTNHTWATGLGISWELGVDGISIFLVLLSALLFPIVIAATAKKGASPAFMAWMLLLEAACIGSFVSLDLILFFLFFELTLIPTYFLITGWGFARRAYAAIKFFVYTFLGSAFLLVGILFVAFAHEHQTGVLTFSLPALIGTHLSGPTAVLCMLAFSAAFAIKAPLFPLHTWSPDAYTEAPTGASMILAAVMAKLGTYGILRFDLNLFPQATKDLAPVFLTLGVIGILYGAIVACVQRDMKRLVAYSSLAHIGFIVLGTFALTTEAVTGSVLQMVNHGLITAALFLIIGWIYERRKTWQVSELRGLQASAPVLAGLFTVVMLASIGLPGLNGFVGEFLILSGTFISHRWWAVVATTGVIAAAVYLLWAFQQAFHGKPTEADLKTPDATWFERLAIAPLIVLIVFIGVYPKPLLDLIQPSVKVLLHQVEHPASHPASGSVSTSPTPSALGATVTNHRLDLRPDLSRGAR